jgi:hypothetical protein
MSAIPQSGPESCSDNRNNFTEGEYVFHLARFHQHIEKASAVLERRLLRGAPTHVTEVFRRVQTGLQCAQNSVRLVTHSARDKSERGDD